MPDSPFKYKALTIYHYHDGPLVFSFCPWADRIGSEQIWKTEIASIWSKEDDDNWKFSTSGPLAITLSEDDVDWSDVGRQ